MGKQAAFKTNPVSLEELLRQCGNGKIQLPDFQRSWVWDEERIKGLIASISQAFPVGALMTLEVKLGAADTFARRPIQGADAAVGDSAPDQLLLDGQQRMTSLYQTCLRNEVVHTVTPRLKLVKRWFYIDMRKSMDPSEDRENAIVSVPEDRRIKSDFDRKVELDLSTAELEYENLMFPLNQVFDSMNWMMGFWTYWTQKGDLEKTEFFKAFNESVLQNFKSYQLPVIALSQLNRGPEQRTDKRPQMADLRESGSIEQDADMVILLHRDDYFNKDSEKAGEAEIIVAKHRAGPTADITVAFQGHYSRFKDMGGQNF